MAVCIVGFFDLLRDGFTEPGTTAPPNGELGAKPPRPPKNPVKESNQMEPGVAVPALPTGRESSRE